MGRGAVQNMVSEWKSRGMSLGLKVRLLRATAFPISIHDCESWAMTSGDKKRVDAFELWCYPRLLRVSWTERKTNNWVVEKIGSVLMLRKSMSERKMRFFGDSVRKNGMEKRLMQGKMEGKRRRGTPATTWFQDLKEWTKLDIAGASQLATDRERWRNIIKVTAAERKREREGERERETVGGFGDTIASNIYWGFIVKLICITNVSKRDHACICTHINNNEFSE